MQTQIIGQGLEAISRFAGARGRLRQGIESQLGIGRIVGKSGQALDLRDFERLHALAQRRFECTLPTRLDMLFLPQRLQITQALFF